MIIYNSVHHELDEKVANTQQLLHMAAVWHWKNQPRNPAAVKPVIKDFKKRNPCQASSCSAELDKHTASRKATYQDFQFSRALRPNPAREHQLLSLALIRCNVCVFRGAPLLMMCLFHWNRDTRIWTCTHVCKHTERQNVHSKVRMHTYKPFCNVLCKLFIEEKDNRQQATCHEPLAQMLTVCVSTVNLSA